MEHWCCLPSVELDYKNKFHVNRATLWNPTSAHLWPASALLGLGCSKCYGYFQDWLRAKGNSASFQKGWRMILKGAHSSTLCFNLLIRSLEMTYNHPSVWYQALHKACFPVTVWFAKWIKWFPSNKFQVSSHRSQTTPPAQADMIVTLCNDLEVGCPPQSHVFGHLVPSRSCCSCTCLCCWPDFLGSLSYAL